MILIKTLLSRQNIYTLGIAMLLFYAVIVFEGLFSLIVKIPIGFWHLPLASFLFLVLNFFYQKQCGFKLVQILFTGISAVLLMGLCFFYASFYHETLFDAIWYHHDAVYLLADGWNPYYAYLLPEQTAYCQYYLNHFPIGHWVFGASIYNFSHHIEWAKGIALYSSIMTAFILCAGLLEALFQLPKKMQVFFGLLIALNPIALLNFNSFYVDGVLANLLSLSILFWMNTCLSSNSRSWLLAFLTTGLLAYLKLTGTAFAILILASAFVYLFFTAVQNRFEWFLRFTVFSILLFIGIGFHPFVSNWIDKGHPFFPAVANSEINVFAENNYPQNFIGKNRFEKFGMAFFSKPGWWRTPDKTTYKIPFERISDSCYGNGIPDIGAMGTLFPELFVLGMLLFVLAIVMGPKNPSTWKWLLGIFVLIGSFFINQEAWVLRYIPHIWLLLILFLIFSWQQKKLQIPVMVLGLVLFINSALLFRESTIGQAKKTKALNNCILQLKHHENEYAIDFGWAKSFKNRLGEHGIDTTKLQWISPTDTPYFEIPGSLGGKFKAKNTLQAP